MNSLARVSSFLSDMTTTQSFSRAIQLAVVARNPPDPNSMISGTKAANMTKLSQILQCSSNRRDITTADNITKRF